MAIPEYQAIMLPLMQVAADGKDHVVREVIDTLADQFRLTAEERRALLPSGVQEIFANRVWWARTYLTKAGLLESTGRGRFRISPRGLEVLKEKPLRIDTKFLQRFPEFVEFQRRARKSDTNEEVAEERLEDKRETPAELLEAAYQNLRRTLAQELLERVKKCSPQFFERLVVDLLVAMGYGGSRRDAGEAIGRSGDEGIDGIIKEDKLGLDAVYIQAKRWDHPVGRPVVQAFAGSLEGQRARKGVFITTSQFSRDAREYVERIEKRIVLIDGEQLAQLMIDHDIGVTEEASYTIKKVDLDYFEEE